MKIDRLWFLCLSSLVLALTMLAMEQPAYAYIDLGTGSMIFQVAIATVVAALAGLKIRWHRLKQKVKGVGEQPDSKGTVGD